MNNKLTDIEIIVLEIKNILGTSNPREIREFCKPLIAKIPELSNVSGIIDSLNYKFTEARIAILEARDQDENPEL